MLANWKELCTPSQTNIAPEQCWLEDYVPLKWSFFSGRVCLQEGITKCWSLMETPCQVNLDNEFNECEVNKTETDLRNCKQRNIKWTLESDIPTKQPTNHQNNKGEKNHS